jgi:integrase
MPRPNQGPRLKWLAERGTYYVQWFEQGKRFMRSTGTADRRQAEAALSGFIVTSHKDPTGPRDPDQVSIAETLSIYGERHAPTVADPARIGHAIAALLPFWGQSTVGQITPSACDRYAKERAMMPATIRRELTTLRAAINYAVREGFLTRPVPVKLPEKPEGRDRWLTISEAAHLLNAARTARGDVRLYLPLFIMIALYTGARKEAVLSLKWPQIDLNRGRIDFSKGHKRTSKGRALLPIPDRLLPFLRYAWQRRSSDIGPVIHDKGAPIKKINSSFDHACRRAGLHDVTPHTLRHTRGTWSAQAGVDLWQIAGWLGQSLATTTELYAHHHPDFMDAAKKAADRR